MQRVISDFVSGVCLLTDFRSDIDFFVLRDAPMAEDPYEGNRIGVEVEGEVKG